MKIHFLLPTAILLALTACSTKEQTIELTPIETGTVFSCRAVSAVSDNIVWASGTGNTVIRSTDGGKTWECHTPADSLQLDFRCLYAWDENNALVFSIASPAIGLKTSDGGKTWQQVYYNNHPRIFLNSVHFSDSQNGIAVGDPIDGKYVVLRSDNGGSSWEEASQPEGNGGMFAASNGCVQLLPSGKAVMVTGGTGSYCYFQEAGSRNWERAELPLATGDENRCDGGYGIYMTDDNHGFAVGGNYAKVDRKGNIAYTQDGGRTWQLQEEGSHGFTSSIQPVPQSPNAWVAAGSDGLSWSSNNGKTWTDITPLLPEGIKGCHALSAARNGRSVFGAGADGKMIRIGLR